MKRIHGSKAGLNTEKLACQQPPAQPPRCPECASQKVWKDGIRQTKHGDIQRWLCRNCGFRFSDPNQKRVVKLNVPSQIGETLNSRSNLANVKVGQPGFTIKKTLNDQPFPFCENVSSHVHSHKPTVGKGINSFLSTIGNAKVCVSERESKNLAKVETRLEKAAGATKTIQKPDADIINYLWFQKKRGYPESTIKLRVRLMKRLVKHGAELRDPESVLKVIAEQENWSSGYKLQFVEAYKRFAKMLQIPFDAPTYRQISKLPWIPTEKEIDVLISATGKKASTMLQLLKETAMRSIEAWHILWTDIDSVNNTIRIESSKRGNPRMFKVSNKLIMMLNALPKKSEKVFGYVNLEGMRSNFYLQRKRISRKLQNPRLQRITFHTLRHWKATMEYHKTKDILHVKEFLGHRTINSTLVYTHLINLEADEYITRITKSVEGCRRLIEAGFQYVTDLKGVKVFKKPK